MQIAIYLIRFVWRLVWGKLISHLAMTVHAVLDLVVFVYVLTVNIVNVIVCPVIMDEE